MHADFLDTQLVAYVSLREALGFQMRVEKVLRVYSLLCNWLSSMITKEGEQDDQCKRKTRSPVR